MIIEQLKKEHFEPICTQMEWEEDGKIILKSVQDLTDVLLFKSTISMSKHFHDFETYLSRH